VVPEFSLELVKCKVMHIGRQNHPCMEYYVEGHKLEKCNKEKDLGIIVFDDLKVGTQCNQAFSKAIPMLGILTRNIINKTLLIMVNLYKTLIRPHIEYPTLIYQANSWVTAFDIYEECLEKLGLWTLEDRRNCADVFEVSLRLINNHCKLEVNKYRVEFQILQSELKILNQTGGVLRNREQDAESMRVEYQDKVFPAE